MSPPPPLAQPAVTAASAALTTDAEPLTVPGGVAAAWADCSRLVRPRIALLVLATVWAAAWITADADRLPAATVGWLLFGTALVAASSSIANQVVERDSDRLMPRTARRPVAAGRLGAVPAAWAATFLLAAGLVVQTRACGWQPAAAALATWLLYVVVYTPLKRTTPLNTAVGAVAGALPVAIGWLAADGPRRLASGDVAGTLAVAALATVLYLWQFPHFMAIAWLYRRQYAAAGLRMLTVDDPSGLRAAGQALAAALAMIPVSLVLAVPSGSVRLFMSAAVAAIVYAVATVGFALRRDDASARTLLFTSLSTLLALLVAAVVFGTPA
jgi:protoheme IX farnesyltransferase